MAVVVVGDELMTTHIVAHGAPDGAAEATACSNQRFRRVYRVASGPNVIERSETVLQSIVLEAELEGFEEVRRVIAVREDLTLVDLHYALQSAFGWDDDHLYAFWVGADCWSSEDGRYTHPCGSIAPGGAGHSAAIALDRLVLAPGGRLSYVFGFEREWRVRLHVEGLVADDGRPSPRLLESAGAAPPQYPVHVGIT
jgi:hypothetical protein